MLLIITLIMLGGAMYFAKPVLAPGVFALVVGVVIAPLADRLERIGVSRVAVASSLLLLTTALLALLILSLDPLMTSLASQVPKIKYEIRGWLDMVSGLLRGIESISSEIEETIGAAEADTEEEGTGLPTLTDALWLAPNFGAQMFIFAGTLFFFVLTRNELYEKAGSYAARFFRAERAVARYFAAVTIVNGGLGLLTAAGLALIGLPGAWIWGLAAAILNFILYLGPLMMLAGLTVAGLTQIGGAGAVLPPLVFLAINIAEAQFVTPAFVGRQLDLNPLIVFWAIVLGLWIWGPVGAIVALPLVLWCGRMLVPPPDTAEAVTPEHQ
ncbi:AI-2E family transporter [Leisingera daeponensis]|uniref:AI-2E family transporter n=1 Tax=Leisingera daeponensis TaxID=405746 RepID=UPI000183BC60|nr:AI-2E family transporter [Leisingera daeponensis]EDZ48238.1 conserved domain protein, putative [Rhodobacterales bacterium Y4I]